LKIEKLISSIIEKLVEGERLELRWKRENGSCIFAGAPVGYTGREIGLLLRLNLLRDMHIGKAVLSIGCGLAAELLPLRKRGHETIGLDPEQSFLSKGKNAGNADYFIQAIGEQTPLRAGIFDLVLLFEVLEHVMNPDLVLNEIDRLLKPGGIFFITVPNRFYPFETHGIQICQKQIHNLLGIGIPFFSMVPSFLRRKFERARIYTKAELASLLRRHRFELYVVDYTMPTLDNARQTQLTRAIRHIFLLLGRVPFVKELGPNLMMISIKGKQ
jgi:SAM-dependent methyltransferase